MPAGRATTSLTVAAITAGALVLPARGRPLDLAPAGDRDKPASTLSTGADPHAPKARLQEIDAELQRIQNRKARADAQRRKLLKTWMRMRRAGMLPWSEGIDGLLRHAARLKRLERATASAHAAVRDLKRRHDALRSERQDARKQLEKARRVAKHRQRADPPDRPTEPAAPRSGEQEFYGLRYSDQRGSDHAEASDTTESSPPRRLSLPVRDPRRVRDARRPESRGPGLELHAPVGTPVHAADSGRVAFADRYGSYGRMVMIDHGNGLYTVYGGLKEIEVRVGDELSRRATLGHVGSNSGALFFEVRKGSRVVSPRRWLPQLKTH